jgi:hypothetical protein
MASLSAANVRSFGQAAPSTVMTAWCPPYCEEWHPARSVHTATECVTENLSECQETEALVSLSVPPTVRNAQRNLLFCFPETALWSNGHDGDCQMGWPRTDARTRGESLKFPGSAGRWFAMKSLPRSATKRQNWQNTDTKAAFVWKTSPCLLSLKWDSYLDRHSWLHC